LRELLNCRLVTLPWLYNSHSIATPSTAQHANIWNQRDDMTLLQRPLTLVTFYKIIPRSVQSAIFRM